MAKQKRPALGKGIGALLSSAAQEGGKKYFSCPIEDLKPHHRQPRKTFDDGKMAELIASIKEKGIIQPLVVRRQGDHYQIIAGERRWRAAQKAGLESVPVVIQDVSEDWALEIALIENIQREDLNPLEEAGAYHHLMESFELLQEEVAKRVGKDRSTVANALRLLRLPEKVKNDLIEKRLSMGHARALLALDNEEDIREASEEIMKSIAIAPDMTHPQVSISVKNDEDVIDIPVDNWNGNYPMPSDKQNIEIGTTTGKAERIEMEYNIGQVRYYFRFYN